jgi:hypothetical protein
VSLVCEFAGLVAAREDIGKTEARKPIYREAPLLMTMSVVSMDDFLLIVPA